LGRRHRRAGFGDARHHLPVGSAAAARNRFGIMNAVYGVAWFAGSVLLGVLYDLSLVAVVLTSALFQTAALPIFVRLAAREA
jgi:hypothetical protein